MAKDPAFLFYAQDWITGTLTMTMEERGQYITILSVMHQTGRMDEKTIRFLVGNVSDNLKAKFSIDKDGKWFNKRLEDEIEKRAKFSESRRKNGSKGGRPKASAKPSGLPNAKPINNHTEDEIENENTYQIGNDFDTFFKAYGKQVDKIPCQREWLNIEREEHAKILEHVPKYVNSTPDVKFRKKPLNYLKDRTWLDPDLPNQNKEPKVERYKPNLI
jgi:uncharacterized protein YdaU (DUF1376 family)